MGDTPKDNVVDFKAKAKGRGGDGTDGPGEDRALYYAVTPVIPVDEGDKLIRLKYMTENGYLDILGILNQIQIHNKKHNALVMNLAILSMVMSLGMALLVIGYLT